MAAGDDPPVTLYTLTGCVHCGVARRVLERNGVAYREVRGDGDAAFRRRLLRETGGATVPQIVVRGKPVGGAEALRKLERRGALVPLAEGRNFPVATVRRRLSVRRLPRSLVSLAIAVPCGPWRWDVELVERDGSVVKSQPAASRADAEALAAALDDGHGEAAA